VLFALDSLQNIIIFHGWAVKNSNLQKINLNTIKELNKIRGLKNKIVEVIMSAVKCSDFMEAFTFIVTEAIIIIVIAKYFVSVIITFV